MKKNWLFILTCLILISGISIVSYLFLNEKNPNQQIDEERYIFTGTITNVHSNYLTVKDVSNGSYYNVIVDVTNYGIGEVIAVYSSKPIKEIYPAEVISSKIEVLEKINTNQDNNSETENNNTSVNNSSGNNSNNNSSSNNDSNNNNSNNNSSNTNNSNNNTNDDEPTSSNDNGSSSTVKSEEEVIDFFSTVNNDLNKTDSSESFTTKLKKNFVICVDFLFYGGDIKGYTFRELTTSAKLKVLQLMMSIDSKIDSKLPGYKETISNTTGRLYSTVKNKVVETYLDLTAKVCSNNDDICKTAKQGLTDMKNSFALTWDFIKGLTSVSLDKLSSWYKIWKES